MPWRIAQPLRHISTLKYAQYDVSKCMEFQPILVLFGEQALFM